MIVHLFSSDKFTEPYIDFVNKNFDDKEHLFYIIGDKKYIQNKEKENIIFYEKNILLILKMFKNMNKAKKIIIHGLSPKVTVISLYIQPWLLKKSSWCIWGGDLYFYKSPKIGMKSKLYEYMRKKTIKNLGELITHIEGDVELARKWYKAKGKYRYSFMYLSNVVKEQNISLSKNNKVLKIQIGNSADPTNNHIEILEKLEQFKDENIELIVPLSYGDKEYRDSVIVKGNKIFGEKFKPIVEFMEINEYLKMLNEMDVAIFNHNRQQGVGNITTLLSMGKKVYLRSDVTTWDFCKKHDLKVYDSCREFNDIFIDLNGNEKKHNREIIKENFTEERLKKDLRKIFE